MEGGVGITCARVGAQIRPKPSQVGRMQSHSGKLDGESERDGYGVADGIPERRIRNAMIEAGRFRRAERFAALQATGFMARRNEPAEGAHALGGEIAVVGFHPQQLPQRRRHEGTPASNTAKKGMRKGYHGQTSEFSNHCPSGQNGMLVRGKRWITLNAQTAWVVTFP
jgi:hypothetical protein